jgi:MFS family permease
MFTLYAMISAVALAVFVLDPEFWSALLVIAVYGFASSNASICSQTIVQAEVDQAMRARVMGMLGLTFRAVPATGALAMGWIAERFGLTWPFVAAALACLACWPMLNAKLRKA